MTKIAIGLAGDITNEEIAELIDFRQGNTDTVEVRKRTMIIETNTPCAWLRHITGGLDEDLIAAFRWININNEGE